MRFGAARCGPIRSGDALIALAGVISAGFALPPVAMAAPGDRPSVALDRTAVVFPKTRSVVATLTLPASASGGKMAVAIDGGLLPRPIVTSEPASAVTRQYWIEDNNSCPQGGPGFFGYEVEQPAGVAVALHATFRADLVPPPPHAVGSVTFSVWPEIAGLVASRGDYVSRPIRWSGLAAQHLRLQGWRNYPIGAIYEGCAKARHVSRGQRLFVGAVVSPARSGVRVQLIRAPDWRLHRRSILATATTDRHGQCVFRLPAGPGRVGLVAHVITDRRFFGADSGNALFYKAPEATGASTAASPPARPFKATVRQASVGSRRSSAGSSTQRDSRFSAVPVRRVLERRCGDIVFMRLSDNGAFDIRASRVSCVAAKRVAGIARRFSIGERGEVARYATDGFRCVGRNVQPPNSIATLQFRCARATARITFVRAGALRFPPAGSGTASSRARAIRSVTADGGSSHGLAAAPLAAAWGFRA